MALFTGRGGDAGLSRQRFAAYQKDLDRRRLRSAGTDYINETTQEPYVGLQKPIGNIAAQHIIKKPVLKPADYATYGEKIYADSAGAYATTGAPVGTYNPQAASIPLAHDNIFPLTVTTQNVIKNTGPGIPDPRIAPIPDPQTGRPPGLWDKFTSRMTRPWDLRRANAANKAAATPTRLSKTQGKTTSTASGKAQGNPKQVVKEAKKEVEKEIAGLTDKDTTSAVKKVLTQKNPKEPPQYVNVQLINDELNAMRASREQLLAVANAYRRAGMGVHFIEAYGALNNMTAAMVSLSQQKAINMFETNGDPRMLQQMWSQESGSQIVIIPRSDGKWDVERDGQPWKTGVTTAAITNPARVAASQKYAKGVRAGRVAAQTQHQKFLYEAQIENMKKKWDNATTKMQEQMKTNREIKEINGVAWAQIGGRWVSMETGEVEGPDGETVPGIKTTRGPSVGGGSGSMTSIVATAKGLYS